MSWNLRYAKDKEGGGFKPPAGVQSAAKHALELIEKGKAGDGFTSVGRGRAHQLASGKSVGLEVIKKMHSYFARHAVDKKGKDWDNDSPGKVAWLAWGGDAGRAWANSIMKKHGDKDSESKKEASVVTANQYIKHQGGKWVILNKEGKVLSHHDSKEKAEEAFAAMMANKHKHGNYQQNQPEHEDLTRQPCLSCGAALGHGERHKSGCEKNKYVNLDSDW